MGRARIKPPRDTFFLPYQSAWIKDKARLKIMEKGRQIGLSWSTAYALVRNHGVVEARTDAWVSSRDEIQAKLFLDDCKAWAKILNMASTDLKEQLIDPEKGFTAYVLQFANGRRIHSMSSNPDAQAGKRGTRVLDEFALHPDPRKLYGIANPGKTWGGSLEIISTHRGSANYFNSLITEVKEGGNPKGFSLHTVTLQDALDQGFLSKLQGKLPQDDEVQEMDESAYFDKVRSEYDEETFLQEFCCVPADDASAFLPFELIDSCTYGHGEDWEWSVNALRQRTTHPLYIGVDVGREHDLTVIWTLERVGDVLFTRSVIELRGVPFSEQEAVLYELLRLPSVKRCCIDSTGLGMQFAERANERFGYKVEGIRFTPQTKEELAYPVRAAFEDRSIRIPRSDDITSDLRGIRKETTLSGNVRFNGERSSRGHCDRFWALALAIHAGKAPAAATPPHLFARLNQRFGRQAERSRRACL